MHTGIACNIDFAEDSRGRKLADIFLQNLDDRIQAKFFAILKELLDSDRGFILNEQKMEKLKGGSGIWELKAKIRGVGNFRVFCFREGPTWFLTNGFHKRGNRTPKAEIKRAVRIRDEFLNNN